MDTTVFEGFHGRLLEKRHSLIEWLRSTSPRQRQVHLGPTDERAVQSHLQGIENAIEKAESRTLGHCEVCHGFVEVELLEMDYTACVCLSHFSPEERRLLEADLELAQTIQRALLPQQVPEIPGLELAAFTRPAQIVAGDYFDFLHYRDGTHGLAIGDVAGKGMAASLLMASLQAFLRTVTPESDSPIEVVTRLNRLFSHNIHYTTFATLFLARWDATTHTLDHCNAGHNPPLLYRRSPNGDEQLTWLRASAPAIGLVETLHFKRQMSHLAPNNLLLCYTDGVTEATNPQAEEFGYQRLADLIRQSATLPAPDLVSVVRQALEAFTDGHARADDTTIIACRVAE
ncbi:MAG: PP2C family protein-serine/threonine phosphatase [Chloroflexota bacterium]|nr:PP2C family protein-serine/threonine phosphatase [Chloroflexota bacterium]